MILVHTTPDSGPRVRLFAETMVTRTTPPLLVWLAVATLAAVNGLETLGGPSGLSLMILQLQRSADLARRMIEQDRLALERQLHLAWLVVACYGSLWWWLSRRLAARLGAAVIVAAACQAARVATKTWALANGPPTPTVMLTRSMSLIACAALITTWLALARALGQSCASGFRRKADLAAACGYTAASGATAIGLVLDESLLSLVPRFVIVAILLHLIVLVQDRLRATAWLPGFGDRGSCPSKGA